MTKPKDKEQEEKRAEEMLDSVPAYVSKSSAISPSETTSKLIYILIKHSERLIEHSQRLNRLTITLIVLTVILAIITIVYIIIAFTC